eukprot:CAMPEP_0184483316 /NCGR_PEP_ID=MMETSP0113_2-20130426/4963_1 /TAXON_ID=91329 /ORGANISM="Norrisiella sphaerica, Strain BC52" /LENGTH=348 /DNA_ID=CAMNT_0026863637 /DNA_START=1 /DNA_END=1044 /DNA_ORIENTATION=-
MPARAKARCSLESLAQQVFHTHTASLREDEKLQEYIDWEHTGVEWWVQHCDVRPKTKKRKFENGGTGDGELAGEEKMTQLGIGYHWDKDEEMRLRDGIYVHACIATVTYLTDTGPPTLILEQRIEADGKLPTNVIKKGYVSYPAQGKHIAFDARYLHAVPHELSLDLDRKESRETGGSKKGQMGTGKGCQKDAKMARVTFLANVWINHRPLKIRRFPEAGTKLMADVTIDCSTSKADPASIVPLKGKFEAESSLASSRFGPTGNEYELQLHVPINAIKRAMAGTQRSASPPSAKVKKLPEHSQPGTGNASKPNDVVSSECGTISVPSSFELTFGPGKAVIREHLTEKS